MTVQLYQTDSFLREFDAQAVARNADEGAVALDRTAFYPGGGGQPNDVGRLLAGDRALSVTGVKRQGSQVWHWLDGDLPDVGETVIGRIDWTVATS